MQVSCNFMQKSKPNFSNSMSILSPHVLLCPTTNTQSHRIAPFREYQLRSFHENDQKIHPANNRDK